MELVLKKILSNINAMGTNTLEIFNGKSMGDKDAQKIKSLTIADGNILKKQNYVESVTPNSSGSGNLVSVTERTKEIGIRMAIGAKQKDILRQFLVEAALICLIGGVTGVLLSLTIGGIFSIYSIVMAVVSSALIGIIFGYMPAKNAAELDPINALSVE